MAIERAANAKGLLTEMCAGREGERRCLNLTAMSRHVPDRPGSGALLAAVLVAAPAAAASCRRIAHFNVGDFCEPKLNDNE